MTFKIKGRKKKRIESLFPPEGIPKININSTHRARYTITEDIVICTVEAREPQSRIQEYEWRGYWKYIDSKT